MKANGTVVRTGIVLSLIAVAVWLRLLPHPANFAPVAAIAIFGGTMLPRRLAVWVPLGAMAVSDMIIGFYHIVPVIWACYALIAIASSIWMARPSFAKGAALTLSASAFFFVVTNFAVWLFDGMYAHTWAGLVQCYAMALPFLRNTVLSDAFYVAALFGAFALARAVANKALGASTHTAS